MRSGHKTQRSVRKSALPISQVLFLAVVAWPCYQIGIFAVASNFREVVSDRVYRSGQPGAGQLETWIRQYEFKTVINLRGPKSPRAAEEEAVAAATGVDLVHIALSASRPMTRKQLLDVLEALDTAKEPLLLHCAHGVDRSGTVSALAAWLIGGQPYEQARWQAYVPPGPWKNKRGLGHISDTLADYESYCRFLGLDPDDPVRFRYWVANVYHDPQHYLTDRFGIEDVDANEGSVCLVEQEVPKAQPSQAAAMR